MKIFDDVGRWALLRTHGSFRILFSAQAFLEDIGGAIEAGQTEMAIHQARELVLLCLSVHSLKRGGEPLSWPGEYDRVNFNPLYALPYAELVRPAFMLISQARERILNGQSAEWFTQLEQLASDAEDALELDFPLPTLRSPEGLSIVLNLFGKWDKFATDIGLPSVVPDDWAKR